MVVEIKNSEKFAVDLKKFSEKVDEEIGVVARKIALRVFSNVILNTPVDTGRARSNWNLAVGSPDASTNDVGKNGNPISPGEAAAIALQNNQLTEKTDPKEKIYISNNVEYIEYLENGTESIKPFNMVKKAVMDVEQAVKKALEK